MEHFYFGHFLFQWGLWSLVLVSGKAFTVKSGEYNTLKNSTDHKLNNVTLVHQPVFEFEPSGHGELERNPTEGGIITLGEVIGFFCLICCILYCMGIGWKIVKVCKGTYEPQEPVFLKYK